MSARTDPGTEPRCDFSDLPRSYCSHCTGRIGHEAPAERPAVTVTWEARYHGHCDWCGDRIHPGLRMGRDAEGGYVCSTCLAGDA